MWARTNGCEWDSRTCSNAIMGEHLNVLNGLVPMDVSYRLCLGTNALYFEHSARVRVFY